MTTDLPVHVLETFRVQHRAMMPLTGGMSVESWRVEADEGVFVLRRHDIRKTPYDQLHAELEILELLSRDSAIVVPRPVRQRTGELLPVVDTEHQGKATALWSLLRWVDGATLGRLPNPDEASRVGVMLARLHEVTFNDSCMPDGLSRPTYDATYFPRVADALWLRAGALLHDSAGVRLKQALVASVNLLDRLGQEETRGLIHADVHDGNVVFQRDPRRLGLIDFGRCGYGCRALDVAMAMHYLTDDLAASLLQGYQDTWPLSSLAHGALTALRYLAAIDNLSFLSGFPEEAESIGLQMPELITQADRLVT